MEIKTLQGLRTLISRLAALVAAVALLGVLDGLVAGWRTPVNLVNLLPGESTAIDGPAPEAAQKPQDLAWKDDTRQPGAFQVDIDDIHRGYFLGTPRWRGRLKVSPDLPPGKYALAVYFREDAAKGGMVFRVVVHPDAASLNRSDYSQVRRGLGISPFWVAGACGPLLLMAFGAVFFLSSRLEKEMAALGLGEIFRVVRREGVMEVAFGLGRDHGVTPGSRLSVLNDARQPVGQVRVEEASATDAVGITSADQDIRPGFWVTLH
jgi:hypothetical protein